MSKRITRTDFYWPLFKHMSNEHGLTLIEDEMRQICGVVSRMMMDRAVRVATERKLESELAVSRKTLSTK